MHCETNILHLTGFFQLCDFSVHDICIYEYLLSEHYLKRNYKDNYILENELTWSISFLEVPWIKVFLPSLKPSQSNISLHLHFPYTCRHRWNYKVCLHTPQRLWNEKALIAKILRVWSHSFHFVSPIESSDPQIDVIKDVTTVPISPGLRFPVFHRLKPAEGSFPAFQTSKQLILDRIVTEYVKFHYNEKKFILLVLKYCEYDIEAFLRIKIISFDSINY